MYDIAVAGNLKEILPFKAIGMKIYPIDELEKNGKNRKEIINEVFAGEHKIIMVSEIYFENFEEIYNIKRSMRNSKLGILLPIHNGIDIMNIGRNRLQRLVENAIGVDIFRDEDK
jgi:V/A-type H+-transporting ATPase subunit F